MDDTISLEKSIFSYILNQNDQNVEPFVFVEHIQQKNRKGGTIGRHFRPGRKFDIFKIFNEKIEKSRCFETEPI